MDPLPRHRQLNRGFGDTFSRAFEFAAVVGLFLLLGWLLDRWLGTQPGFMLVLVVVALVGQFVRMWYAYDAEMRQHEANFVSRNSKPDA